MRFWSDNVITRRPRILQSLATTEQIRDLSKALAPWLEGARSNSTPSIPNPVGRGTVHLVIDPIGCDGNDGLLIAGSQQTGFPSEADRLLLTVGANQAAAVLQRQRAEGEAAKQQLMLALRIAGSKLQLAKEKVNEINTSRPEPQPQNRSPRSRS